MEQIIVMFCIIGFCLVSLKNNLRPPSYLQV